MEELRIDTDGGTSVQGDVNTEKDFVGRDKVENTTAFADNNSVVVLIQNPVSELITVNVIAEESCNNSRSTGMDVSPCIKAFNILRGDKDVLWAIELFISNPLSRHLWVNQVEVDYRNNGNTRYSYCTEPPIYTYNLILSNISQVVDGNAYLLDITAKESDDNFGRRVLGKLH
mgnify:CR=1 FL=1